MNKNVFYNILNIAQYAAFIVATILVLVFQFTASQTIMVLSLVFYVVAFAILTISEIIGVKELYLRLNSLPSSQETETLAPEEAQKQSGENIQNKSEEIKEIKGKIRWGYGKVAMCAIMSLFALLVLILF